MSIARENAPSYFQRIVNHKVYALFLLSHINKTQRGKHSKTIFRHCCKISVEDMIFQKLIGKIKTELKSQKQEEKTPTLH